MAQEKQFETKVKHFLKEQNAFFVKYFANAFTQKGIPDILACVNGYFVGVETKADDGHPSEIQLVRIDQIREAGGFAFVLYPSAFESFKSFINDLEHETFNREEIPVVWK